MKKLLILAVAMAAVAANAATFSWKTTTTGKIYQAGSTSELLASGTVYLFDAGSVSQAAVLTAFVAGTDIGTLAKADTSTVSDGAVATSSFDVPSAYSAGDTFSAYIAIVVDDSIYIGNQYDTSTPATGNKQISLNEKNASQAAALDSKNGCSTAGWYAVSSSPIPEPTSGILMLLGFAGLALRRRRA